MFAAVALGPDSPSSDSQHGPLLGSVVIDDASAADVARLAARTTISYATPGDWLMVRTGDDFEGASTTEEWRSPGRSLSAHVNHWAPPANCSINDHCAVERVSVTIVELATGRSFYAEYVDPKSRFSDQVDLENRNMSDREPVSEQQRTSMQSFRLRLAAATTTASALQIIRDEFNRRTCNGTSPLDPFGAYCDPAPSATTGGGGGFVSEGPHGTVLYAPTPKQQKEDSMREFLLGLIREVELTKPTIRAIYGEFGTMSEAKPFKTKNGDLGIRYDLGAADKDFNPYVVFDSTTGMPITWKFWGTTTKVDTYDFVDHPLDGSVVCSSAPRACETARDVLANPDRLLAESRPQA